MQQLGMHSVSPVMGDPADTPLGRGIKLIGIGKYGSKPLSPELIAECRAALLSGTAHPLQMGAFIGALLTKGPTPDEQTLETCFGRDAFSLPTFLVQKLCPTLPEKMLPIAVKLVRGHTLQVSEARQLGDYLFGDQAAESQCEHFRGLAVSIMRVRHETNDEYAGLYQAAMATLVPGFQAKPTQSVRHIVQLAEPFDGVEHSYLITPLLANFVQQRGYGALSLVGRTPGPKYDLNAHDLYMHLGCDFLQSQHELATPLPTYGWVLDQKAMSPALNRWVDRRRILLKRPFLSTLEKLLNPARAKVLVTSVFHITYQMKMAELALMAGFDAAIVLKRGLEGTLAPSTSRASGVLCAVRTAANHLFFQHFDADRPEFAPYRTEIDNEVPHPQAADNARLIRQFLTEQRTQDAEFDNRVRFGQALLGRGLDWIEGQLERTA
ncbi:Anthranilate phosphoribosyltransferase-like protein [Fibrella aestuarina BUZ 2]|uniref:Anthranilate phosphoribosyltransferase-like protein n=1 Tax=Fibrella aestuarina BUZ 2 TaxID=1166018 RepID=I0K327_9BACT|nr:Anthranilate phosphoribosyltransferase-like protein [Fibrella aestuarina]CCG98530.1 Anthranilate phosphoribosyltransferase-like protein [Fibrella aestuarina BUZ 2]